MRPGDVIACDLAVVGSGAAGLAAALRSAVLGMDVVLVTRGAPGGRLRQSQAVPVLEGLPVGLTGEELVERAMVRARRLGVRIVAGDAVALAAEPEGLRRLALAGGGVIEARALIAATGADRATGHVVGSGRLLGAGVHTRAPRPGEATEGGEAVVAGEPADAARAALALCDGCERVTVVTGAASVAGTVSPEVRAELRGRRNVGGLPGTTVVGAEGVDRLEVVVLRDTRTGRLRTRTVSSLWLLGAERARTAWLPAWLERDPAGRLSTRGGRLPSETALAGVFAAGDTRVGAPCGLAAIADGMDTAEQASARLRLDLGRAR